MKSEIKTHARDGRPSKPIGETGGRSRTDTMRDSQLTEEECVRYVHGWCSHRDGPRYEIEIPETLLQGSVTGGRQEILAFVNRLEVAQAEMDRHPEFKVTFAREFYPFVLTAAAIQIAARACVMLLTKIEQAQDRTIEAVKASCEKFPYLRVVSQSGDHLELELVLEAISLEAMGTKVKEILSESLPRVFSQEMAADWAMPHILAWTIQDIAGEPALVDRLRALPALECDAEIWHMAWTGEEFLQRYSQAASFLICEVVDLVVEAVCTDDKEIAWFEALLGLRSSDYYRGIAAEANSKHHPILKWAAKYAGMPESSSLAVAEILRAQRWRNFSGDRARRQFIFRQACLKSQEFDHIVLTSLGGFPGLNLVGIDEWDDVSPINENQVEDFEEVVTCNRIKFDAVDALITFNKAMADLQFDCQRVAYARIQGYSRHDAHKALRISKKRVSAGWRALHRSEKQIRKMLSC